MVGVIIIGEDGRPREAVPVALSDEDIKGYLSIPLILAHVIGMINPGDEVRPAGHRAELGVATGFIDLVAVDNLGRVYVIEAKRNSGREAVRKAVGQLLHYAASLWSEYKDHPDDLLENLALEAAGWMTRPLTSSVGSSRRATSG